MCWKQSKNLWLGKIMVFCLCIWYLNKYFPSHTGDILLILHLSVCSPHKYWNLTIRIGEGQISISLTLITRAIRALLWTATAQHWPHSSTASYAFSLACPALFLNLILHFSHALFCINFFPLQFALLLYPPSILSFLLNPVSSFQISVIFPPFPFIFLFS